MACRGRQPRWRVEGGGGVVARDGAVHATAQCTRWGGVQVVKGGGGGMRRGVHTMERGVSNLRQVREDVRLHHVPDLFLNVIVPETWGQ